jgi:hypothetical protein
MNIVRDLAPLSWQLDGHAPDTWRFLAALGAKISGIEGA